MNLHADVEFATRCAAAPSIEQIEACLRTTVAMTLPPDTVSAELAVRVVDASESQRWNREYRGKDLPTNVLAFPADVPAAVTPRPLGDLVLCADVIRREAAEQGKSAAAHYAHMLVHGSLHLLGFDHDTAVAAAGMEGREVDILRQLGYSNPYAPADAAPTDANALPPR